MTERTLNALAFLFVFLDGLGWGWRLWGDIIHVKDNIHVKVKVHMKVQVHVKIKVHEKVKVHMNVKVHVRIKHSLIR